MPVCGEYVRREGAQGQDTRWAGEVAAHPWRPLQPMGWGAVLAKKYNVMILQGNFKRCLPCQRSRSLPPRQARAARRGWVRGQ